MKQQKKQPKDWKVIQYEFEEMQRMSCVPQNIRKLRVGTVIDEEKSVRWNREEVEQNNQEYLDAVAKLNTEKNMYRDSILKDIYYAIQCDVGHNITEKQAMLLWSFAYERGHSNGWYNVMDELVTIEEIAKELLVKK